MKMRMIIGLSLYVLLEILTGIIFYCLSRKHVADNIGVIDIVKIVSATFIFYVFSNLAPLFMGIIGQKEKFYRILPFYSSGLIMAIICCIIFSFSDYFAIIGIFFLIPELISCIIWRKRRLA
jgi:hypothetical protein